MSCLDLMYHHQVYGMRQYVPSPPAPCTSAYYHHHHHHSQQKRIAAYNKMQEALEMAHPTKQEEEEKEQPAEMEYLNSRCVLLTYFQGDIGAVVDEHFSRALSQISSFNPENTTSKSKLNTNSLWKESPSASCQRNSFPSSLWANSYQATTPPCLSGVHPDFSTAPSTFSSTDHTSWRGETLHQTIPPPPPASSESWHYPLASQASSPYTHMHDVYMYHHHGHPHAHHHHHLPASHLDPRYGHLLMPPVRASRISAPQCDITKTDASPANTATSAWNGALHSTVDIVPSFGFETGIQHQDKGKDSLWF
ncbi:transcription cofactor vestigial-like protein 3 isoform X1 [Xenopus laevis]|uniref:Transcription cofactor vestigial-like protein 3 isoform X1 n=1 Tax=Xenopus laevis TaxID=8355 RepID=A0A8J0UJB6_XENLA|nr:transcription cofactor vestigial-like protein 3 isoform X1 [Xenopus laevis]